MKKDAIKSIAYREAAALLEADMSAADLQCDTELSEADASRVREFIRNEIVQLLELHSRVLAKSKPRVR